jgi:hypothetical protein
MDAQAVENPVENLVENWLSPCKNKHFEKSSAV